MTQDVCFSSDDDTPLLTESLLPLLTIALLANEMKRERHRTKPAAAPGRTVSARSLIAA